MEKLYTVEQAADMLQVTPKTVRRWLQSKQLKGVLAGRFWRIQESDLKAFLRVPDGESLEAQPPEVEQPKATKRKAR
jgi:excisionase family DNA binding protein